MTASNVQRFGPYVILDRIGDGGMAEIFLAKMQGYSGFEKLIALKKIHPRYSQNQTFAQMLIHEAKLAAALQHFNVVQVLDLGEIDGQVFIAMEYVRGRDLAAVLSNTYRRRERLPLALSLCIGTEFLAGLDYAHRCRASDGSPLGVIHRDISPQNLLISYEGEVKVTDFGIARVISEKGTGFNLPGNLHGKFGYMSPEQVLGREIDQRSDIFSAGVVLWEMLTGQRLFRGKEHKETIKMIVSMELQPPSATNPEVPDIVDRVVLKALAREPNERYQTTGALLGDLARVADALPRRAATRDLSVYMRRQFGVGTSGYAPLKNAPGQEVRPDAQGDFSPEANLSHVSGLKLSGRARVPLGKILLEQGALSASELELALAEQRARGGRIGELLLASGALGDDELVRALATQAGIRAMLDPELLALSPPLRLLQRFPRELAERTLALPISSDDAGRSIAMAVADPYDDRAILEAKVVLGVSELTLVIARRSGIRQAIRAWYREEEEQEPEVIVAEPEPQPSEDLGPPVVLLADGDPRVTVELAARVREEDCEVVEVHDGKAAREVCRTRPVTVAFLDAALPKIDGFNILLELRSKNSGAAVFVTSGRADEFRQAKALELGADDFVVKPFSVEVLTAKIRRELKKRESGRRAVAPEVRFDGVSGSLKDMTALDIVQSLELGKKSAHVVLQYEDGRSGEIDVRAGELRGATAGAFTGEEAFFLLMGPGPGLFRIEYQLRERAQNIVRPNTYLMIEAMRRLDDEARAARGEGRGTPSPLSWALAPSSLPDFPMLSDPPPLVSASMLLSAIGAEGWSLQSPAMPLMRETSSDRTQPPLLMSSPVVEDPARVVGLTDDLLLAEDDGSTVGAPAIPHAWPAAPLGPGARPAQTTVPGPQAHAAATSAIPLAPTVWPPLPAAAPPSDGRASIAAALEEVLAEQRVDSSTTAAMELESRPSRPDAATLARVPLRRVASLAEAPPRPPGSPRRGPGERE
jgi:serine/threonine protein kinase/CheY-like chemotaxis protein